MKWPPALSSGVALSVLLGAASAYQYLRSQSAGSANHCGHDEILCTTQKSLKPTKEQRKAAKSSSRRAKKDQQLVAKKHERAKVRVKQQQEMSDEQKREQMERIKMQRVEQYVRTAC